MALHLHLGLHQPRPGRNDLELVSSNQGRSIVSGQRNSVVMGRTDLRVRMRWHLVLYCRGRTSRRAARNGAIPTFMIALGKKERSSRRAEDWEGP